MMMAAGVLAGCATGGGGAKSPLVGSWNLTADWNGFEAEYEVVVNPDSTGTIEDLQEGWSTDLENVSSEGLEVSFDFEYAGSGGNEVSFVGAIIGDSMEGRFSVSGKEASVVGKRN